MGFVFSKFFYFLLALGFLPLSLSWNLPALRWATAAYDVTLLLMALYDWRTSRLPPEVSIKREFEGRFAIGAETAVRVAVRNASSRWMNLKIKDEYPSEMRLLGVREANFDVEPMTETALEYTLVPPRRGRYGFGRVAVRYLSRLKLVWCEAQAGESESVKVYPNLRRAREVELKTLGARSLAAAHRRVSRRGEGREFESLREYVPGDELRHISWAATARRGRLTTRQYQIERDQTILVALDAGRLMTARVEGETKFDAGIHAALALLSAASRGGDNAGVMVFGRRVGAYVPPSRGREHTETILESLHAVEPELIEPSYTHAFEFIAANTKRRALVVVLTDLVDEEGSRELLESLKILRPRHLPLVVTIGDRDLQEVVRDVPATINDLFTQSVAEEIIYQREAALRLVEKEGGLALDVTAAALAPALLETYIRVKEQGRL
jgi:uncharacterized protein (DUF58 family)